MQSCQHIPQQHPQCGRCSGVRSARSVQRAAACPISLPSSSPPVATAARMSTTRLDCMPFFRELATRLVGRAAAQANGAVHNRVPFCEIGRELARLEEQLQRLGGRSVVTTEVEGCTILQQVRRAVLDASDLCQQYEDPTMPNLPVVFHEVYNGQMRNMLARLRVLCEAMAAIDVNAPTLRLPKVSGLLQQVLDRPLVDYCRPHTPNARSVLQELEGNTTGQPRTGALVLAAQGHWIKLEQLLCGESDAAKAVGSHLSVLHEAVMWQQTFPVAALLSYGANPNCKSEGDGIFTAGSTPLHVAAALGSVPMVRLLLAWNADPALKDGKGRTPAMVAATAATRSLFDNVLELVTHCREACSYAFHEQFGQLRRLLNECDLPLNIKFNGYSKYFLIHQVVHGGNTETSEMLLEYGASSVLRTRDMELPSQVAAERHHMGLMGVLQLRQQDELEWLNDPSPRQTIMHPVRGSDSCTVSPAKSPASSPSTSPRKGGLHGIVHTAKDKLHRLTPHRQHPSPSDRVSPVHG
eukprot:GGOE01053644.1.p1 GENE.GGOE01053644.1~~GGOE01053644.1.p1  ORF type:complete len:524 (+),score=147.53 GGOE01053644.1:275-1846(+)